MDMPAHRNMMFSRGWVKLASLAFMVGALALTSGCCGLRGAQPEKVEVKQPVDHAPAQPMPTPPLETQAPPSQQPEGPRPGELAPLPDLKTIYFDFDRSNIRSDQLGRIQNNLDWLLERPDIKILIEGHCDERGTVEYNFALGERRAQRVKTYLVENGLSPERISVISKGEEEPAVLGHTEQAYARNRRVEFKRVY